MYIFTGLEVSEFALLNANHFWVNVIPLSQLIRNIFGSLRVSLDRLGLQITFLLNSQKQLFYNLHPFPEKF